MATLTRSNRTMRAGLLLMGGLVATTVPAAQVDDGSNEFRFDASVPAGFVFQVRAQQRLLAAAQEHLADRRYSDAFQHFRELLSQPWDSARPAPADGPIRGVRLAVLQALAELPQPVRRQWSVFCEGPASADLQEALRKRSRNALARIVAEYPCSSAAADALITEIVWTLQAHDVDSARRLLPVLKHWVPLGVLSRSQMAAVRRLESAVGTSRSVADVASAPAASAFGTADPTETWAWQENPWNHRQGPDAVSAAGSGSWHGDRSGWQVPLLAADSVIARTPVGIARLNRATGAEEWFVPFRSVGRRPAEDQTDEQAIFGLTPAVLHRIERSRGVLYFVDGLPFALPFTPISSRRSQRPEIVLRQGATHLVAVRSSPQPTVLWQVSGGHDQTANPFEDFAAASTDFSYSFRLPEDLSAVSLQKQSAVMTPDELKGHVFLSSPRVHAGRLYVTTEYDSINWLNCFSADRGVLQWQQPLMWRNREPDDSSDDTAIVGAVNDDTVVCLSASGLIAGCDLQDGHIVWIQSVRSEQEEESETSDFWLEMQADSRLIPQGEAGASFGDLWLRLTSGGVICGRRGSPVICCFDRTTGERRWSVSRRAQGGPADRQPDLACIGATDRLLIMMGYGHCRGIDVETGRQLWVRPLGSHSGRVCCEGSRVCVALDSGQLLTIDAADGTIVASQRFGADHFGTALAADQTGLVEASAWRVQAWHWRDRTVSPEPDADTLLDRLAVLRLQATERQVLTPVLRERQTAEDCIARLAGVALNTEQHLRFDLLTMEGSQPSSRVMRSLDEHPGQLVRMLSGWQLSLRRAVKLLHPEAALPDHSLPMEDAVLMPEQRGGLDQPFETVEQLLMNQRYREAELLLLNLSVAGDDSASQRRDTLLQKARSSMLAPGITAVDPVGQVKTEFEVRLSETDGYRLNQLAGTARRYRLRVPGAVIPTWSHCVLMTELRASMHVGLIDRERGIETDWAALSDLRFPSVISYQDGWENPGLVVVQRGQQIGVTSLLSDNPLNPLWLRSQAGHEDGQVIALDSRQLVVCSNAGIHSYHPLTGAELWSHVWSESSQLQHLEGQYLKVYLTEESVILLSSLGTGCTVLRADSGAVVREGTRPSGDVSRVIDGYLLTKSADQHLTIVRLSDGSRVPFDVGDQPVLSFQPAGQLGRHHALLITAAPELLIVDLESATVRARIQLPEEMKEQADTWTVPHLIRRSGLVYASLAVRNRRFEYVPESVFGEPVLGQGVLICIDPKSGRELWQSSQHAAVITPVFGDPCPFLVQWSTRYTHRNMPFDFSGRRQRTSLEITVRDSFTGEVVGKTTQHMAARPLQVIHDAEQQKLRIVTEHSEIVMAYKKRP